jgi:iron complex outermembrane receptor protein
VGDADFDKLTWKAGAEYDLAPDNLLYFTVSTGFKAGGFYAEQDQFGNTFEPETLTAYALGSKNRFFDNTLQANIEVFFWDYEDHQESHLAASPGGYAIFQTENIGQAEIWGIDLEAEWAPTATDTFSLQLQYLDAEFTEFSYTAFAPGAPPVVDCPSTNVGGPFFTVNCDGFDAIRAPDWRMTLGYSHRFKFGSRGDVVFDIWSEISDGTPTAIEYLPAQHQDSYTRTDLSLTYLPPGGAWSLAGWVHNIEDSEDITTGFVSPFTPLVYSQLKPARTYGVRLQYAF